MLVLSAAYAVLITKDPDVASAIALGYVALLLTIFAAVEIWKKP
jgi:cell division protein FtsW (lipid II flippase)